MSNKEPLHLSPCIRAEVGRKNPQAWDVSFSLKALTEYLELGVSRPKAKKYFDRIAEEREIEGRGKTQLLKLKQDLTSEAMSFPPNIRAKYFPWLEE